MKVNRGIRTIQPFKLKDNFNIDYSPYYIIEDGIYKFSDKLTRINFMYKFGIMCQCERKTINDKLTYCYNDIPITEKQKMFIKNRAIALNDGLISLGVPYNCGCNKNKKET